MIQRECFGATSRTWAFGSGNGCAGYVPGVPQGSQQTGINKGRTLTHELGHFFNLDHTFDGCGTNCNASGDKVCDTPASNQEQYGCPSPGSINGCVSGQKVLTMNYMDYTDDACMYMFTPGQATRMLAQYNSIKNQFSTTALSNETFLENQFSIYPNPSKQFLNINLEANSTEVLKSAQIFDLNGRLVMETPLNASRINIESLQNAKIDDSLLQVYFLELKENDNYKLKSFLDKHSKLYGYFLIKKDEFFERKRQFVQKQNQIFI
jgi:hypothetical protein